ncbi:MAG: GNAT family N-acetyltransferase [bacterium]
MDDIITRISAGSTEWIPILAQFTTKYLDSCGRSFTNYVSDRLIRATRQADGIVMTRNGLLRGIIVMDYDGTAAEITVPWTMRTDDDTTAAIMAKYAIDEILAAPREIRHIRAERQLVPGESDGIGLKEAGFELYQRTRMTINLPGFSLSDDLVTDCTIKPWDITKLDTAAELIYSANDNTLDKRLYPVFFGNSPSDCRHGILSILAGKYGAIHPQASLCLYHEDVMAGVNLVVDEGNGVASVVEISVSPHLQRRGYARTMMLKSLHILQDEGVESVDLAVTNENHRAYQMYLKLGFTEAAGFPVGIYEVAG